MILLKKKIKKWFKENVKYKNLSSQEIFTKIYLENRWGSRESVSGVGSEIIQTQKLVKELNRLIKDLKINSILDIPCGDFNWMKKVDLDSIQYLGADIVSDLIERNKISNEEPGKIEFKVLDIISDKLPKVDLIIVRDCLVHFSNKDVLAAWENLKSSGSKYILTTTFPRHFPNFDIATGDWRPLNLFIEPFFLSNPLNILNENCTEENGAYQDKSMGLWELNKNLF
jgi:SAM-dependent methyltransferase